VAQWLKVQPSLREANINGPMFISVGTVENVNAFLDLNPDVPRELMFMEDSANFDAYKAVGFKTFLDSGAKFGEMPDAPKLSRDVFWTYASNMNKIAPKVNTLEAVTRVGGTFVLDGDNVIYGWADKIPGDHPAPEDVLQESGILQA